MEKVNRILITLGVLILLLMVFFLIMSTISRITGFVVIEEDSLDLCLEKNDIVLYINSMDSKNDLKKIINFEYLNNIKIINCYRNNNCPDNLEYPSWIINGQKINKDITFDELIALTKC
jgi:hypothetical protein